MGYACVIRRAEREEASAWAYIAVQFPHFQHFYVLSSHDDQAEGTSILAVAQYRSAVVLPAVIAWSMHPRKYSRSSGVCTYIVSIT